MMRSLSSAVTGLRAHQTKMDVIGNNIANVNTYGFKSSRVTFNDIYYQTLSSGNTPVDGMGGTNPTQIGYGAKVATIDVMNTVSAASSTDRALDIYINGDGMIAVKDPDGNLMFTRMGVLGFDALGRLVDMNGNFVQGLAADATVRADGSIDPGDLDRITVDPADLDAMTGIAISNTGEIIGTKAGDNEISPNTSKMPAWLLKITLDPPSDNSNDISVAQNLVGNIKVVMEALSSTQNPSLPDWITSISSPANSMVSGDYSFYYDETSDRITAVNQADGRVYTGTYRSGSTIELVDASGNVGFVIETHNYNDPTDSSIVPFMTAYYDMNYKITVSGYDKGGNYHEDYYDVVGDPAAMSGDIRFGALGVTLSVDASKMTSIEQASFAYNYSGVSGTNVSDWLQNATAKTDTSMLGNVYIKAGYEYNINQAGAVYSNLNFLKTGSEIDDLIKKYCEDNGYSSGTFTIDSTVNASGEVEYQIFYAATSGATPTLVATSDPVSMNGESIIFNYNGDAYDAGTTQNLSTPKLDFAAISALYGSFVSNSSGIAGVLEHLKTVAGIDGGTITINGTNIQVSDGTNTITLGTYAYNGNDLEFTLTNPDGTTTTTYVIATVDDNTVSLAGEDIGSQTLNSNVSGNTLANVSTTNKIYLLDNSLNTVGEATYTGQSTIIIGDVTLQLSPADMKNYFENGALFIDDANEIQIGNITRGDVIDWAYSRDVASASAGTGENVVLGQIALAQFQNMAGMKQAGDSYFEESLSSGEASFWIPGLNGTGELTAGYLEMSNVDISKEFTDMITTQRGFQANTRIITVSDEMLQELVNLKR